MAELRLEGLDAWVEGRKVRRSVEVAVTGDELRIGEWRVPLDSIFWTSRRAGLLMLFARRSTLALKGPRGDLERLARELESREVGVPSRLPAEVTGEGVIFTAGAAVTGRLGERDVRGLRVAVVTRSALHLISGGSHLRLPWPAEEARAVQVEGGGRSARALVLGRGEDRLRLLYLFPEEIRTALQLATGEAGEGAGDAEPDASREPAEETSASRAPPPPTGEPEGKPEPEPAEEAPAAGEREPVGGEQGGKSLELFTRGEVAPPVRAEMPALHLAVDALQEAAEDAARRLSGSGAEAAELDAGFFETHFLELGEVALGPFLLRKSAAGGAPRLERAVEAMDAEELQQDTRAAVANAVARLAEVYERELDRLVRARRAPARVREEHELSEEGAEDVRLRLQAPFERISPLMRELEERQRELLQGLRRFEEAPPEGEEGVDRELEAWKGALRRVDRAFESAWHGMVGELLDVWEERFLPRLAAVGASERRRFPEWVRLAALALIAALAAAAGAILLIW